MQSSKKWFWVASFVLIFALAVVATRVKGGSSGGGLEKFQADGIAALDTTGTALNGTIRGNEIGTATIADQGYAMSFIGFTGNGADSCILGGGNITITAADGSTLTMVRSGMDCAISGMGLTNAATGNHTFIITGGTGRFAKAIGNGNYTFSINNGVVVIHIDGNIQAPGDHDND